MVDIIFATIGIFVIVFALQEIENPVQLIRAPYNVLIVCTKSEEIEVYLSSEADGIAVDAEKLGEFLEDRVPTGGRFLVAVDAVCFSSTAGESLLTKLVLLEEEMSALSAPSVTHQFEIVPLGRSPNDKLGIISRWRKGILQ